MRILRQASFLVDCCYHFRTTVDGHSSYVYIGERCRNHDPPEIMRGGSNALQVSEIPASIMKLISSDSTSSMPPRSFRQHVSIQPVTPSVGALEALLLRPCSASDPLQDVCFIYHLRLLLSNSTCFT